MPTKEETREKLRKFIEMCVEQDISAEGEDAIQIWEEHIKDESGGIHNIYKLSEDERRQIKDLIAEFYAGREQEEERREQRRIAEEKNDEVVANHYADRIKKIVLAKTENKFLPKPKLKPTAPRRKSN